MIVPTIKSWMTHDGDEPLQFKPDIDGLNLHLQLTIGPFDKEGGEIFGITVCDLKGLQNQLKNDGFILPRHHIILPTYNPNKLKDLLERRCQMCAGDNWSEVAAKLNRWLSWEFEDYREYKEK